jgi:hypothetical protein
LKDYELKTNPGGGGRMKKLIQAFIVCGLFMFMGGTAKSETSQKLEPIEFMELVKIFSFNEKDFASAFAWDIASNNKSINWSTPLMIEANKKDDLPYIKKGEVLVMVNKTSCKAADGNNVKWGISMSGPRMGVFNIKIQPKIIGFCSAKLEEKVKPFSSAKELGCDFCNSSNGEDIYKLSIKGKKNIFVSEERSCGSAGCSYVYRIAGEKDLMKDIKDRWGIKNYRKTEKEEHKREAKKEKEEWTLVHECSDGNSKVIKGRGEKWRVLVKDDNKSKPGQWTTVITTQDRTEILHAYTVELCKDGHGEIMPALMGS